MPAGPLKAVKAAYLEDGEGDSDDVRDSIPEVRNWIVLAPRMDV